MAAPVPPAIREAEVRALQKLFDAQDPKPTHAAFGKAYGIGSTSMVWQYLNNHRPLNLAVATKFAIGLRTTIDQFSPRLAAAATYSRGVANNHLAVVPSSPAVIAQDPPPEPPWPFPRLSRAKVCGLAPEHIRDLEAAMLLTAAQLGIHIAKRKAA